MNNKFFLTVLFGLLLVRIAFGFQVTPASKAIEIGQGDQETITIRMLGTKKERIMIYLGDYLIDRRGTVSFIAGKEDRTSRGKEWISPLTMSQEVTYYDSMEQKMVTRNAPVVDLEEGDVKEVSFLVSPPIDAKGEYYATLHFRDISEMENDNTGRPQVSILFAIAARLSINIKGSFVPLRSGSSLEGSVYPGEKNTRLISSFHNSGNVHLDVYGRTFIRRKSDNRVFAELPLTPAGSKPENSAFIMPGGIRDFEGVLERPLPAGEYIAETVFDYGSYIKPKSIVPFSIEESHDRGEIPAFSFEPQTVYISSLPGNTEVSKITIYNMGSEAISLEVLSDTDWISVLNSKVIIPDGSFRNVGILSTVPESIDGEIRLSPLLIRQVPDGMESSVPIIVGKEGDDT